MDLIEHTLESASKEYRRKIWAVAPLDEKPRRLCILLDAEYQLGKIEAVKAIEDLEERGVIPSLACVFISQESTEARHHDLTCNIRYSRFIAREVVNWATENIPQITREPAIICGMSLGGLAAAYLVLAYPEIFSHAIAHSGSFWWNSEWFAESVKARAPIQGAFWLSAGDKETAKGLEHAPTGLKQEVSQIDAIQRAHVALTNAGATSKLELFHGGHDLSRWKTEFPIALSWAAAGVRVGS